MPPDAFASMFFGDRAPGQDDGGGGSEGNEDEEGFFMQEAAASESGDDDGWVTDEDGDAGDEAPDDS